MVRLAKPRGNYRVAPLQARESAWSQLRVSAGVSMRQAAELSGLPKATISFIEQGRWVVSPYEADALLQVYKTAKEPAE